MYILSSAETLPVKLDHHYISYLIQIKGLKVPELAPFEFYSVEDLKYALGEDLFFGGQHGLDALVTACFYCNSSEKSDVILTIKFQCKIKSCCDTFRKLSKIDF